MITPTHSFKPRPVCHKVRRTEGGGLQLEVKVILYIIMYSADCFLNFLAAKYPHYC